LAQEASRVTSGMTIQRSRHVLQHEMGGPQPLMGRSPFLPLRDQTPKPPGCRVNLSAQDLIVISTALVGAIGNAYLFVAAVHDGHRTLYGAAAVKVAQGDWPQWRAA
jgi:hypothetical protein